MIAKVAALFLISALASPSYAHDFWLEPESFSAESGKQIAVHVKVGHGSEQHDWPIQPHRVVGLRSIGPDSLADHQKAVGNLTPEGALEFKGLSDGIHVLWIESTNSFSGLPPKQFNQYVEEEGILPISRYRSVTNASHTPGRELYSRRGKTLVQIGTRRDGGGQITKPVGMSLEIVPLQNPFELKSNEVLEFQVLYFGEPVEDVTLHITQLDAPENTYTLLTGPNGIADAEFLTSGEWLFHTAWSSRAEGLLENADYATVFSSLTFEIE